MITRHCLVGLTMCLVCLSFGCNESGDPKSLSIVLQADPATKARVEKILKENPELVVPGTQTRYSMIIVKPDSRVDYKIVQVAPDPSVDYKIIVVDPASGKELPKLSRQLGNALREKIKKQQKESKK